ncbi:hypothetical protein NM688_g7257 [Phlebia brevispora]|uniref:Uncharacterized protein n=1 Tax=Phlebia brevispora TaxID=194682 RepID=A0ACC1S7D6_9APHY|nr:hypothetical protein NM688_g7257 [Phlebia brevispora]
MRPAPLVQAQGANTGAYSHHTAQWDPCHTEAEVAGPVLQQAANHAGQDTNVYASGDLVKTKDTYPVLTSPKDEPCIPTTTPQ